MNTLDALDAQSQRTDIPPALTSTVMANRVLFPVWMEASTTTGTLT